MLTLDQVVAALQDRNLKRVADGTGLAYNTVCRVANGTSQEAAYETVKKLSDYLESTMPKAGG